MCMTMIFLFFFKQKTAYEMRISDWSSDVCSSDLCQVSRGRQIKATINGASKKRLVVYGYVARFPHGRRNERRNHVDPLVKIEISETVFERRHARRLFG